MKVFAKWLLIFLTAIIAAGCSSEKKEKIFYMTHDEKAVFGSLIKREFDNIARKNNHPVEYFDAGGSSERQIYQLEKAVENGAKIVILLAVDEEKLVPAAEKAADAGVAVVAVNRHLQSSKIHGVYPDEYGAGRLQAEYMERNLPVGACVFYLKGTSSQFSSQKRWEGFHKQCIEKRPDIRIVDYRDGSYSRGEGRKIMEEWLENHFQIDAVICGNDEMALGALAALKEAHRSRSCMISGIDATDEALAAIESGDIRQTVKQDAARQANGAYQMANDILKGKEPSGDIMIPFISITKENLSRYK